MAEETPPTRLCAFEGCSEPAWRLEDSDSTGQGDPVSNYCLDHDVLVTLAGRASRAEPAKDPSLVPCAVSDCPAFRVGGNLESNVDHQKIGQYCLFHGTPGPEERLSQRVLPGDQPGLTHARTCLLDHAAELQAALAELTGEAASVDVAPRALEQAAAAWKQQPS